MRRVDKEIRDRGLIDQILAKARVLRLGLSRDNRAYVVPVSFGYDGSFLYIHTAREGMKIDYIRANRQVCFELEHDVRVIENETDACRWTQSFYSVIGFGTIEEITDTVQKTCALNRIMRHYSGREWALDEKRIEKTRLWRVSIDQITGKKSSDKTAAE
ncbi:MAG TPA: pyridoxamine 5'-phosphate oxidase family protein [Syntrophales bacterium]|nr:pyridoxamine 5'-phosphate oxidase family protein [Syntrophales bacterium]HPI57195.1 pyridoxamine 5'-phosphate oxidase family protein [Syntrophales bacterium]HPN23421.1 pyridoxamine 5'-phosphate oxidase family protein [Syntrophales bacterium]HQM28054.1 pyridoxamine 5'-phosphate oxidase family protein [Syntrophales bacterium]